MVTEEIQIQLPILKASAQVVHIKAVAVVVFFLIVAAQLVEAQAALVFGAVAVAVAMVVAVRLGAQVLMEAQGAHLPQGAVRLELNLLAVAVAVKAVVQAQAVLVKSL
jgi:hypothetical protein